MEDFEERGEVGDIRPAEFEWQRFITSKVRHRSGVGSTIPTKF